jgi:hypothetical protein
MQIFTSAVKPVLLLVLIVCFVNLQQVEREAPDLRVVKFSWGKEQPQKSRMIKGAQNPGGPITTPIADNRDLGSRRTDLRTMEKKAAVSAQTPAGPNYQLRLELKNTGANVVKSLIWEFRPTALGDDYQPKQYLCGLQVKPGEKKVLDVWTPFAPVKVVSANTSKDALKDGEVVINQIEYADGSLWKKRGWNYRLPADSLQKVTEGKCSVF